MHQIFLDSETEGVLPVDVTNAFEQTDKQATFYNNTLTDTDQHLYRAKHPWEQSIVEVVRMHQKKALHVLGDPLLTAMHTLAISQLFIQQQKVISSDIKQVWFADDAPSAVAFYFCTTIVTLPQWL